MEKKTLKKEQAFQVESKNPEIGGDMRIIRPVD
jgi:hypothetical protein